MQTRTWILLLAVVAVAWYWWSTTRDTEKGPTAAPAAAVTKDREGMEPAIPIVVTAPLAEGGTKSSGSESSPTLPEQVRTGPTLPGPLETEPAGERPHKIVPKCPTLDEVLNEYRQKELTMDDIHQFAIMYKQQAQFEWQLKPSDLADAIAERVGRDWSFRKQYRLSRIIKQYRRQHPDLFENTEY